MFFVPESRDVYMSQNNQKVLTAQDKANAALEAACAIEPIERIAQKYGVFPKQIKQWQQELIEKSPHLFTDHVHFHCLQAPCNDLIFRSKQPQQLHQRHYQRHQQQLTAPQTASNKMQIKQIKQFQQVNNVLIFKNFTHKYVEKTPHQATLLQEDIREKERKRIAREIHDELGQNLMAVRLDMLMLHKQTAHAHPRLHEIVDIVLSNVDTTIQSVKSIVNDLRPFRLELGLRAAIEWQLQTLERISGIHCTLIANETIFAKLTQTLNNEQTLVIFRILQEALSNIVRHSFATEVKVILSQNAYLFSMVIKDNGIGMHRQNGEKRNSFGIIGIKERVTSINGECIIDSKRGNGTALLISIPIGE